MFEKMNEEIEWWYDISFVTATTKGKLNCLLFWTRKVLFRGLSKIAPLNRDAWG